MPVQSIARKKACSSLQLYIRQKSSQALSGDSCRDGRALRPSRSANGGGTSSLPVTPYTSISESQKQKKNQERDFLVSVLETSVTKRDAKAYMNKFIPLLERKGATSFKQRTVLPKHGTESATADVNLTPTVGQTNSRSEQNLLAQDPLFVALVKFRAPEIVGDVTFDGVAKTLSQLRKLGLISIIVIKCDGQGQDEITQRQRETAQAIRLATAIDGHDDVGACVIDSPISISKSSSKSTSPFTSQELFIDDSNELMEVIQGEQIAIIPSFGYTTDTSTIMPVSANDAVLALTRQLSGLQFMPQVDEGSALGFSRAAEVYRIIVLDSLGGIPAKNRATGRHLFLNLEQEFSEVLADLGEVASLETTSKIPDQVHHLGNAKLAKQVLSLLPPTSSVVVTTPQEAAKDSTSEDQLMDLALVGTRRGQNPLIHSLLTDKPIHSSSLPTERFRPVTSSTGASQIGSLTTLAKRGMPLTIFPDPKISPWKPPRPGHSSLRLTDPCIDLSRLVNLIEDSFGRKLDIDHYLKRVNGSLAGIIIAGEYEGGALLTWENPSGSTDPSRLVPYLDKFAVLRKSQGAGGVADIVFNAMVRDCFPNGVCWRSRKNNPVNKWYFERSRGTVKLPDMNWTMFWTTPMLALDTQKFKDYEAVCRGVEPSWADQKHIVD
ncbi:N-acetylglutamate synthase [Xylariaceae sp. FL0255]|nr:N-acetylglutamate synthase [Xylariaceae sp. FL0255]